MNSKTSKVLAVFLTLCLLLSLAAPAFAAGNQIIIGTKEELLTFAQNCTLDSAGPRARPSFSPATLT